MELARRFRVSESTISRIVRGATYQNGGAPSTLATGSEDEIATLVKRMQETKRGVEAYGAVALAGVGGPPIVPSVSEATAKARAYWVMTRGEWPPEYTPTPDDLAYFGLDKPDSID
jgi:anti-sigma factor ChrR (cupin superfamily)